MFKSSVRFNDTGTLSEYRYMSSTIFQNLSRMAHLQELLAAAGFKDGTIQGAQLMERLFDVIADDVNGAFRLAVSATHRFLDDRVDDAELLQVLRRQFQGAGCILGEGGAAP